MVREHHGRIVRLIESIAGVLFALSSIQCAHTQEHASPQSGVPAPLSRRPGDVQRGKAVAVDSNRGNCVICHRMPIREIPVEAFGDLGPSLEGVGSRYSVPQLRLRIVDARRFNPQTIMPPYHVVDGLRRVQRRYAGRPILSAEEIEDLLAYLTTLR